MTPSANQSGRVLIYSHDSFGLGHLRRCRAIAHYLVGRFKKLSVLIISGSPIIGSFDFRAPISFPNGFSQTSGSQWRFPILLQYRFPTPILKPFVEGGVSFDRLSGLKQAVVTASRNSGAFSTSSLRRIKSSLMRFIFMIWPASI